MEAQDQKLKHLVIAAAGINSIDASALQMLSLFIEELNQKGVKVYWTGLIGPLRDRFHKVGILINLKNSMSFLL